MSLVIDPANEFYSPPSVHVRVVEFLFRGVRFSATLSAFTGLSEQSFSFLVQDIVDFLEEVERCEEEDEA